MRIIDCLVISGLILGGVFVFTSAEEPTLATPEAEDVPLAPTPATSAEDLEEILVPVVQKSKLGDNDNTLPDLDSGKASDNEGGKNSVKEDSEPEVDKKKGSGGTQSDEEDEQPKPQGMLPVDEPMIVAVNSEPLFKDTESSADLTPTDQEFSGNLASPPAKFKISTVLYSDLEGMDSNIVSFKMKRKYLSDFFHELETTYKLTEVVSCSQHALGGSDVINIVSFTSDEIDSDLEKGSRLATFIHHYTTSQNITYLSDLKSGYVSSGFSHDLPLLDKNTRNYENSIVVLQFNTSADQESAFLMDEMKAINDSLSSVGELSFLPPIIRCSHLTFSTMIILKVGDRYLSPLEIKNILAQDGITSVTSIYRQIRLDAVEFNDLSPTQKNNIITVHLEPASEYIAEDKMDENNFKVINGLLVAENVPGHVIYVKPEPATTRDKEIHISFFVSEKKKAYHAISQDAVLEAITVDKLKELNLAVKGIYKGMPNYLYPNVNIRDLTGLQQSRVVSAIYKSNKGRKIDSTYIKEVVESLSASIQMIMNEKNMNHPMSANESLHFISPTPLVDNNEIHLTFFVGGLTALDLLRPDILNQSSKLVDLKSGEFGGEILVYKNYEELKYEEKLGLCTILMKPKQSSQRSDIILMGNKLYDLIIAKRNLTRNLGQIRTSSGDFVIYRVFTILTGLVDDAHTLRREMAKIFRDHFEDDEFTFVKIFVGMNDTLKSRDYNSVSYNDLSSEQLQNTYTAVYPAKGMDEIDMLHRRDTFTESFIHNLNIVSRSSFISDHIDPNSQRSKRNAELEDENDYQNEDLKFLKPSPQLYNDSIEMAFFVQNKNGKYPSDVDVQTVLRTMVDDTPFMYLKGVSPHYIPTTTTTTTAAIPVAVYGRSGWDDHRFLFVALLVLALVCFIVLLVGLACIRYRTSRGSWSRADDEAKLGETGDEYPLSAENPITDEEIMKSEAMVDNEAPKIDQDNGWMVPLEQGKNTQENTKL